MDIKSYNDALAACQTQLSDYIARNMQSTALPASKNDLDIGKQNFLTKSGWVFVIIGVLAFIGGLLVGSTGIWITGCAAVLSGLYCMVKGRQQLEQEAYATIGKSLAESINKVTAYVSKTWGDFVGKQNESLRSDIIASDMDAAAKAKSLGYLTDADYLHVDESAILDGIGKVDASESVGAYKTYLPQAEKILNDSLGLAAKAQSDIYMLVERVAKAPSAK